MLHRYHVERLIPPATEISQKVLRGQCHSTNIIVSCLWPWPSKTRHSFPFWAQPIPMRKWKLKYHVASCKVLQSQNERAVSASNAFYFSFQSMFYNMPSGARPWVIPGLQGFDTHPHHLSFGGKLVHRVNTGAVDDCHGLRLLRPRDSDLCPKFFISSLHA